MEKTGEDFDLWNVKKKNLDKSPSKSFDLREGEIRRYYEGMNIKKEQSKGSSSDFRRIGVVLSTRLGS